MTPPRGRGDLVSSIRRTLTGIDAEEQQRRRDQALGKATRRALESSTPQRVWVDGVEVEIRAAPVRGSEEGA